MCKCKICIRYRKFQKVLKRIKRQEDVKFLNSVLDDLYHAEDDLNYKSAILEGGWPSSVEQLRAYLARAIQIRRDSGKPLIDEHSLFIKVSDEQLKIGL